MGVRQQEALEEDKTGFVVRHCDIDYLMPAVLDDELVVSTRVMDLGGATATMHQEILRGDQLLVSIDVKLAHMSFKNKRPTRIPKEVAAKLKLV